MIETFCSCQQSLAVAETSVGKLISCPRCKAMVKLISAEPIAPGAAVGDFDARLIITAGPSDVGQVIALGGLPDLDIGKSVDRHINLLSTKVSRAHARLTRLDFGPSRWQITDTQSRNGVFVNDQPIGEAELRNGDMIRIGEYELRYTTAVPKPVAPVPEPGQLVCPSCKQIFLPKTKVCVSCGIDIKTGKPLVTSRELDEDDLAIRTNTWVRIISILIWFGLFPIASEAFGTKKAITIWWITGITVFASLLFFFPYYSGGILSPGARPWMLWSGTNRPEPTATDSLPDIRDPLERLKTQIDRINHLRPKYVAAEEFGVYQLVTSMFIHAGIMHLAGNMVFLLVFGIRVNELIGNLKMAVVYPVLGILSNLVFMFSVRHDPLMPSLGASGAIMGLAGMYFVFFPFQKVHMVIWVRLGLILGWRLYYKIFLISGFWLLVLWVGLNDLLPTLLHGSQSGDGVAHWAHLGGFISGVVIAAGLLITRQVNAHGSDVLSMMLGPTAWKILGRSGVHPT